MSYPGSKGQAGTWQRIIGQMPPHKTYVEPFAGSAQVFFRKRAAKKSFLADLDRDVCAKLNYAVVTAGFTHGENVWVVYEDALRFLRTRFFSPETVMYCDPPYLLQTRRWRRYYDHEFTDEQHAELLTLLKSLGCRVLLSGYPSELYGAALQGWRCISYRTRTRGRTVTECLWCNFPEPDELHDWRFAGLTFRQRFGWGRFVRRWLDRLETFPARKRGFILHTLQESIAQRHPRSQDPATPGMAPRSSAP